MYTKNCNTVSYPKHGDCTGHVAGQPSALSVLLYDNFEDDTGESAVRVRTDNYLILHQKDLENRIGVDNVRNWLKSMQTENSSYQQALDKLSDRDLFSLVRNRHMQAPAEMAMQQDEIIAQAESLALRKQLLEQRIRDAMQAAQPAEPPKSAEPVAE